MLRPSRRYIQADVWNILVRIQIMCHALRWEQDTRCRVAGKRLMSKQPVRYHKISNSKIPLAATANLETEDINNCFH